MRKPIDTLSRQEELAFQVTSVDEVAETLRDDALARTKEKLNEHDGSLISLFTRRDFFESFKYELTVQVAELLAASDRNVQAVYTFDADANPDAEAGEELPPDPTLRLMLVVSTPSAALQAYVDSLDRALVSSLKTLPSPLFKQRELILDVSLLTGQDIEQRRGYAKLLTSIFAPALKVWEREEEWPD